jgi:hypothetical protein
MLFELGAINVYSAALFAMLVDGKIESNLFHIPPNPRITPMLYSIWVGKLFGSIFSFRFLILPS